MNSNTACTLIILAILGLFGFIFWNVGEYELKKLEICAPYPDSEICD